MQGNLEQYVAKNYMRDLTSVNYQAVCYNSDDMIEDALKIMAALNQATQFVKSSLAGKRISAF